MPAFDRDDLIVIAARRKRILAKLQSLSDAPSGAIRENVSVGSARPGDGTKREHGTQIPGVAGKGYADTAPPPGVSFARVDRGSPPSKEFSLYAHYVWRFERAAEDVARHKAANDVPAWSKAVMRLDLLCSMALRDYFLTCPEGSRRTSRPTGDTDAENVARLLADCEGMPAHEAAVAEMTSVAWVRRSRLNAGVDPETGEERAADPRTERILKLKAAGMSQRAIATEVGVSQPRVSQILSAA